MSRKVLLVDDDPNILQGYSRQLRKRYQIETANRGKDGLEIVGKSDPFAVIVSDMQMPEMNGIEFFSAARDLSPDSIRIMLTGNADQKTAIDAVNEGQIFRFLTKPCSPDTFTKALDAGLEQYRLVTAERELLSKTLSGSVSVLTEVLSLVNNTAFGHTTTIRRLVSRICQGLRVDNAWEIEIAAMLSHVGCVALPETTLEKWSRGVDLSPDEWKSYEDHPRIARDLIAKIPRLHGVAEIIACQHKHYDGSGTPNDGRREREIPLGSRILKLVIDIVQLISTGKSAEKALSIIRNRHGWYDPRLLDALSISLDMDYVVDTVTIERLEDGMVLDEHVVTLQGDILVARGKDVSFSMRERLKKYSESVTGIRQPIRVRRLLRDSQERVKMSVGKGSSDEVPEAINS